MKTSLIFNISNDFITVSIGGYNKNAPVILMALTRNYDNLLALKNGKIDSVYLYKELHSMLGEIPKKQLNAIENVVVVLPDTKIDCFLSQIVVYPNDTNKITSSDIKNLFTSAEKKQLNDVKSQVISITPTIFETDKKQFSKAPVGENSTCLKMSYSFYLIDNANYELLTKIFNKLGFKDVTFTYNVVELANLIKISNSYPKDYILFNSNYTTSNLTIVGSNVVYYNMDLKCSLFDLLDDFVHEFDIPYNDARKLLLTYGYDSRVHPIKVPLYKEKNTYDVDIVITQDDLNKKIDEFINKLLKSIEVNDTALKSLAKLQPTVDIPYIIMGELFEISGFVKRLNEKLNKKITLFKNDFECSEDRTLYPVLATLQRIDEYSFDEVEQTVENVQTVTRGE